MAEGTERRRVFNAYTTPFLEYDLEGPVQPEMSWLPISYERDSGQGCYLMRMQVGAVTISHEHGGMEEFLVLEGGLVASDGTVIRPGRRRELRGRHALQLVDRGRVPARRLRVAEGVGAPLVPPRTQVSDTGCRGRYGASVQPGHAHHTSASAHARSRGG